MNDKKPLGKIDKVAIKYEMFEDWIVTAIEGGSNYWYLIQDKAIPKSIIEKYEEEKLPFSILFSKAIWIDKATLIIHDIETEEPLGQINMKSVKKALETICEHHENVFDALMKQEYDAEDADVFFQYAVMGELTFG
jgi:hypothetical protein